jgi:hypothetical protein
LYKLGATGSKQRMIGINKSMTGVDRRMIRGDGWMTREDGVMGVVGYMGANKGVMAIKVMTTRDKVVTG